MTLIPCARCRRFFEPANKNQCLCGNCENNDASKTALVWFAALSGSVIAILLWMLLK